MSAARELEREVDGSPRWEGVDPRTAARLDALSGLGFAGADLQWEVFLRLVRATAAVHGRRVDPNVLRPILRDLELKPQRVSAFYRRALLDEILTQTPRLWAKSTDLTSRNRGKPIRVYTYCEAPTYRPAPRPDLHPWRLWREHVHDAWFFANHAWELERERVAIGYPTEMREFEAANPRPRLGDFMRHLSPGAAPDHPDSTTPTAPTGGTP